MIKWSKKNVLIEKGDEGFTHASHPCVIHIDKDNYLLIFSSRKNSKSHIFMTYAELKYGLIKILQKPKLILSPSKPGYFDGEGLLSCCLVKDDEKIYLYYSGWQNVDKNFWHCDTGRAIIDLKKEIAFREFDGPVMGRDKDNPIFAAITSVHVENNEWRAWYNSGISWTKKDGIWHPTYGIHYATSKNGIDWDSRKGLIIKLKDEYEHSFGRPSVVRWDNKYKMWFSHRGTKNYSTYRIGYAESKDGINWERNDDQSGINISETGWDSESVCYPYLVEHENLRYMLYNGNNYGMTGLGYAVGDKKK